MSNGYRPEAYRHDVILFVYCFLIHVFRVCYAPIKSFSLCLGNCSMRCSTTSIPAGVCGKTFFDLNFHYPSDHISTYTANILNTKLS